MSKKLMTASKGPSLISMRAGPTSVKKLRWYTATNSARRNRTRERTSQLLRSRAEAAVGWMVGVIFRVIFCRMRSESSVLVGQSRALASERILGGNDGRFGKLGMRDQKKLTCDGHRPPLQ